MKRGCESLGWIADKRDQAGLEVGLGKACLMNSARWLATLERCQVLAFTLNMVWM
jgi:hypothetical protein